MGIQTMVQKFSKYKSGQSGKKGAENRVGI